VSLGGREVQDGGLTATTDGLDIASQNPYGLIQPSVGPGAKEAPEYDHCAFLDKPDVFLCHNSSDQIIVAEAHPVAEKARKSGGYLDAAEYFTLDLSWESISSSNREILDQAIVSASSILDGTLGPSGNKLFPGHIYGTSTESIQRLNDLSEAAVPAILIQNGFPDGKVGAFFAEPITGSTHIVLSRDWLESLPSYLEIESVLLEEYGHFLDFYLNGTNDSSGDEGRLFSAYVTGENIYEPDADINDHGFLEINGVVTPVEFATRESLTLDVNRQHFDFSSATSIEGDGTNQGDLVKYSNVVTVDGKSVDAVIELIEVNNAQIVSLDSTTVPTEYVEYLQPRLGDDTQGGGFLELGVKFYEAGSYTGVGTGKQVTLQNVIINSYDIDLTQYQTFSGFSSYELTDNTDLSTTVLADNSVRFRDDNDVSRTGTDARARVRVFYDSVTDFQMRMANDYFLGGRSFFALDFSVGPQWEDSDGNSQVVVVEDTPARSLSWTNISFQEQNTNDGSITGTAVAELRNPNGASFAGNIGDSITFNGFNIPHGLTAVVTKTADTNASITFSGQATAHDISDSLNNIIIEFQDASFQGVSASDVTASTRSDISIDFINVPPTISNSTSAWDYYEGDGTKLVDQTMLIADVDNVNLASASISISSGYVKAEDQLVFNDQNGITGSWDNDTGVLTLTGNASVSDYQSALRSIAYENANEDDPSSSTRTITFSVSDGNNSSLDIDVDIRVVPVNDAPSLTLSSASISYTEGDGAKVLDDLLTLADVDSTSLSSAFVYFDSGFQPAEDTLNFDSDIVANAGLTSTYNSNTGRLEFTGNASVTEYQNLLRSISYQNTNTDEPSVIQRKIQFLLSDGALPSQVKELAINLTPITVSTYTNIIDSGVVVEGNAVELTATLSGASSSEAVQFSFSVSGDSTALAGIDYQTNPTFTNGVTLVEGTDRLRIPAGVGDFKIIFETIDDLGVEITETLVTELSGLRDITYLTDGAGTALEMSSININEGSPYAVFRADGVEGQKIKFEIIEYDSDAAAADDSAGSTAATVGTDIQNSIQKHNGKNWEDLSQGQFTYYPTGSTTLLVRIPINNDSPFENPESFKLKATVQAIDPILSDDDNQKEVNAFGVIGDDGRGPIYNDSGAIDPFAVKDDDRPVKVNNVIVNEGSNSAIFTVSQSQDLVNPIKISLTISDNVQLNVVAGEGVFDDANPSLSYWNGSSWSIYNAGQLLDLSALSPLFVRVDISAEQDDVFEGKIDPKSLVQGESFRLNVHYGTSTVYGTSEIRDDGSGVIFTSEIVDDAPVTTTNNLDDDLDKDGIAPHVEEILATLASAAGKGGADGDLNNDGLPDAEQSAVATLAWIDEASFDSALAGELVDVKPIVSISALAGSNDYTVNSSYQLMNIDVLGPGDVGYLDGSGRPSGSSIIDAPWDALKFELEALAGGLPDMDLVRDGTQVRISIDVSRSEIAEGDLNAFYKYVSAQTLTDYQNAGLKLFTLDGSEITQAGWYDFTQLEEGGDGALFVFENGYLSRINLIITDNSFGDSDPVAGRILDPGTPVRVSDPASGDSSGSTSSTSSESAASTPIATPILGLRRGGLVSFASDLSSVDKHLPWWLSSNSYEPYVGPSRQNRKYFLFGRSGLPPERRFLLDNDQSDSTGSSGASATASRQQPQRDQSFDNAAVSDAKTSKELEGGESLYRESPLIVPAIVTAAMLLLPVRQKLANAFSQLLTPFKRLVPIRSKSLNPPLLFVHKRPDSDVFVCYLACPSPDSLCVVPICFFDRCHPGGYRLDQASWLSIQKILGQLSADSQSLLLCDQRIHFLNRPPSHGKCMGLDIFPKLPLGVSLDGEGWLGLPELFCDSNIVSTPAYVFSQSKVRSVFRNSGLWKHLVGDHSFGAVQADQICVLLSIIGRAGA
jgi:hypothetical protein